MCLASFAATRQCKMAGKHWRDIKENTLASQQVNLRIMGEQRRYDDVGGKVPTSLDRVPCR